MDTLDFVGRRDRTCRGGAVGVNVCVRWIAWDIVGEKAADNLWVR